MGRTPAKKIKKSCELCESEFLVKDTNRERIKRFCSSYCARRFNGLSNKGRRHSDEINKSKGRSGKENAFYGKTHTDETKKLISEKNTGRKRTKEHKEKMSKRMMGSNNPFYGKTHDKNFSLKQSNMMKENNPNTLDHVRELQSTKMRGKLNPAWCGGRSSNWNDYGGKFTKNLKLAIRERDEYSCAVCGDWGNVVHHIDYNKLNCKFDNLITLCNSCHGKTNWNRDTWKLFFEQGKLNE